MYQIARNTWPSTVSGSETEPVQTFCLNAVKKERYIIFQGK
jgi:hypothetical protein